MICGRTYCPYCGEEMIHRDNRHANEASSAFNQIVHREGPRELIIGDVDTYAARLIGPHVCLRLIEHKQPHQAMKRMQSVALALFDGCLRAAVNDGRLLPGSGVYVMRGQLSAAADGRHKVDFAGRQIVFALDGSVAFAPRSRFELWDWLCCGQPWRSRREGSVAT